ncbi:MAG: four helix bundle protein [Gemmatimonadota bacterium]|nr:MAG: four helix bundle protein [Gemmatimonadota bacterium]
MEKVKTFEDLWIWQQARILVKDIYADFGRGRTGCQDFGFKSQIQKAGISIMNNIAEGFERNSNNEFARFLDISKGSCGEVRSMYYPAEDLKYVTRHIALERREKVKQLSAGIASLASHLRKKIE